MLILILLACQPISGSSDSFDAPSEFEPRDIDDPEVGDAEEPVEQAAPSTLDPCALAPTGGPFPVAAFCGIHEVNDPALGGPLPELPSIRCDFAPGDYATYTPDVELSLHVQFCGVGEVVVFTDEGHCFGVAGSGDYWAAHALPGMTIAIMGDRFVVETKDCP